MNQNNVIYIFQTQIYVVQHNKVIKVSYLLLSKIIILISDIIFVQKS